jgi:hypothetical protein
MHTPWLAALAACCSSLLTTCGSSESGAAGGSADLQTDSYLDGALDPNHIFHWTPRTPGAPIELFVEVLNAQHELPDAFKDMPYGPAECAEAVRDGFKAWATHSGAPMRLEMAFHNQGQTFDAGVVRIEVSFHDSNTPGLEGYTRLHTLPFQPEMVEKVEIQVRVGPEAQRISNAMVYALLLHEFGHALGIVAPAPHTGHSKRVDDVMFPTVRWSDLSAEDRLALRELYLLTPTLRRADAEDDGPGGSGPNSPGGGGDIGRDAVDWVQRMFGPELRSEPARPAAAADVAAAAELVRCASCAR